MSTYNIFCSRGYLVFQPRTNTAIYKCSGLLYYNRIETRRALIQYMCVYRSSCLCQADANIMHVWVPQLMSVQADAARAGYRQDEHHVPMPHGPCWLITLEMCAATDLPKLLRQLSNCRRLFTVITKSCSCIDLSK